MAKNAHACVRAYLFFGALLRRYLEAFSAPLVLDAEAGTGAYRCYLPEGVRYIGLTSRRGDDKRARRLGRLVVYVDWRDFLTLPSRGDVALYVMRGQRKDDAGILRRLAQIIMPNGVVMVTGPSEQYVKELLEASFAEVSIMVESDLIAGTGRFPKQ